MFPRNRCQVNISRIRQPRPGCGLGVQVEVVNTIEKVLSSLGSGEVAISRLAASTETAPQHSVRTWGLGFRV